MRFLAALLLLPALALADETPRVAPGEVIVIHEKMPTKPAKQIRPKRRPPPYSDQAILEDRSRRGWAVLDIDATGRVTAVRFLRKAGYGLDELATKEAMTYRFEPAEDESGRKIPSRILWLFEWPSYFKSRTMSTITVNDPCERMSSGGPLNLGSLHPVEVDCYVPSQEDIRKALGTAP
jgi:hypothetical protein